MPDNASTVSWHEPRRARPGEHDDQRLTGIVSSAAAVGSDDASGTMSRGPTAFFSSDHLT
jgi:hypothetical protein